MAIVIEKNSHGKRKKNKKTKTKTKMKKEEEEEEEGGRERAIGDHGNVCSMVHRRSLREWKSGVEEEGRVKERW